MSSSLPQCRYFDLSYRLPSASEWTLSGHSRALERTGFILSGPATLLLDAGIDVPNSSAPDMILITHTHIDHCNALPMLARHERPGRPTHIFAPSKVINRLREFVQLSFSVKVDYDKEVPPHYCTPARVYADDGEPVFEDWEAHSRRWRPVAAGLTIPVGTGKGNKQIIVVQTVLLFHNKCSTVGYIISERRSKVRQDLEGRDKKETAANVMLAKSRGELVKVDVDRPIMAFICDTTIDAITTGPHAHLILSTPVVAIECTYLDAAMELEATSRGHICWSQLCPIAAAKLSCLTDLPFSLILMHFSLRYSDSDILAFFTNPELNGLGEVSMRRTNGTVISSSSIPALESTDMVCEPQKSASSCDSIHPGPCHVLLWLDSGLEEIWFKAFITGQNSA